MARPTIDLVTDHPASDDPNIDGRHLVSCVAVLKCLDSKGGVIA